MTWKGGKYDGEPQCFDSIPGTKRTITKEMVAFLREWLGEEGLTFFRSVKANRGTVNCVITADENKAALGGDEWPEKRPNIRPLIPHPIHFRQGMAVRNALRGSKLCDDWSDHDFDNNWHRAVERVLDQEEK
jgi:hypothetical protein